MVKTELASRFSMKIISDVLNTKVYEQNRAHQICDQSASSIDNFLYSEIATMFKAQTATVNQMTAKEDQLHESIKKLKDFVSFIKVPPEAVT